MRSDKKMYHALFPRVGFIGERGHDRRLHAAEHSIPFLLKGAGVGTATQKLQGSLIQIHKLCTLA